MQNNTRNFLSSVGAKLVIFEFFLSVFVSWFALELIPLSWQPTPLKYVGVSYPLLVQLIITFITILLLGFLFNLMRFTSLRLLLNSISKVEIPTNYIVSAFFLLALTFFLSDLSRSRYIGSASSDIQGTLIGVVVACFKCYFGVVAFVELLIEKKALSRVQWLVILVSLILTIDGMAHIMLVGIVFLHIFSFKFFLKSSNVLNKGIILLFLTILVLFLYSLGIAWKSGATDYSVIFTDSDSVMLKSVYWLIYRLSSVFLSICIVSQESFKDIGFFLYGWDITFNEVAFRFCKLTGLNGECSSYVHEYQSIGRYNFAMISHVDPGRGGASPGVLGSAMYLSPWIFSGFFAGLYYAIISKLINLSVLNCSAESFTLIKMIISVYLLRELFLNPASYLDPFSGPFIGLVATLYSFSRFYKAKNQYGMS